MTGGFAFEVADESVDAPLAVLVVGEDDGLAGRLESRLSSTTRTTVRVVEGRAAALDALGDVDCVVRSGTVNGADADEFLEAVRARDELLPCLAYGPVEETCTVLDALATGYTDVVPAGDADAVDVLGDRVLRAVEAAWTRTRANEQAAALRAERDRFAALFENIPEPTVFYELEDDEPVALDVNPAFEDVFGYDARTVRGDLVDEYIVPDDLRDEATTLNDRIADGEHLDTEVRRSTAEGDREFLLRDVPLVEDDRMRGYAIYTDITLQREREARLREATDRLEAQNERLEAFTGVVSHDLRHPLSVAMTYTELLSERYDDEDLEAVENALERMDDLIQDLLALAQQGAAAQDRTLLDLEVMAREAWASVDTGSATLTVTTDGAAVRADESRLRQLFVNLFANSVEHGSTGSRTESENSVEHGDGEGVADAAEPVGDSDGGVDDDGLHVRVGCLTADDRGFFVADDGAGIPVSEREKVFEQGYSGDGGTGFGLAIVKAVADAHDWSIAVTESDGGGARFAFTGVDLVM
ncbi:ATP-binding protein [Halorubellus sp. PRR65]|uniref:receiver/sensor box histidine kinase n=1 Tax=Halorubellus sp. PRR65 TaxID=3098148 RepID=UPI002B25C421|nr:ATP-binding protein [Halorubellus sp. PRR65]